VKKSPRGGEIARLVPKFSANMQHKKEKGQKTVQRSGKIKLERHNIVQREKIKGKEVSRKPR